MRQQQNSIIGGNIVAEYLPFLFTSEEEGTTIRKTPCVGVKSLQDKIEQQLDGYDR